MVIANPPYIRQEDIPNKSGLQASGYEVYNSTSDLYTYFYELSLMLLAEGGVAAFITSNKWFRSKYGTKIRTYLKNKATLHSLIDFGGYQVFESATVDTNILVYENSKAPAGHKLGFLNVTDNYQGSDLNDYFNLHKSILVQNRLEDRGWTLADSLVLDLKAKIEAKGKPLKDWDVNIYRGVLTGCNEAFIIDTATQERLCAEDPKSSEIIKPILRGKDIHRYHYKWAGKWVIVIPSGWTNLNRGSEEAETYFKAMYPAVYQHFSQLFYVNTRGKGLLGRDDQGDYWWELRDCTYYDEFEKEKIVWASVGLTEYAMIPPGYLLLDTNYFVPIGDLFVYGLLNSKLITAYVNSNDIKVGTIAYRHYKYNFERIPIPVASQDDRKAVEEIVKSIIGAYKDNAEDSSFREFVAHQMQEIDKLVYQLYDMTNDEIEWFEKTGEFN